MSQKRKSAAWKVSISVLREGKKEFFFGGGYLLTQLLSEKVEFSWLEYWFKSLGWSCSFWWIMI
jgi:hypothetical protein